MSHELRTPLNAIILYSELLQEEAADRDGQDGTTITDLQKIQSAGNHLLALINGILDLSKIEAGKMTLTVDLRRPGMIDEMLAQPDCYTGNNNKVLTSRGDDGHHERRTDKTGTVC